MKFKTTNKELKNGYAKKFIFQTGYCDLQDLLHGVSPIAYTCGVYGWNYDAYDIEGILITTGYRGMIGNEIPYELEKKYNNLAKEIQNKYRWNDYEKQKEEMNNLRKEFIKELMGKD